jgi:flagellar protein FliO/FliZ
MEEISGFTPIFRALAALVFVLGLMGGLSYILRRLGLSGPNVENTGEKRLKVIESTPIDARRKMVLVQRDNVQHLVILGVNEQTVVETGIKPKDN